MTVGPIRIVVVDDHHLFRAGVIELLHCVADFQVVSEGASGSDAVTMARAFRPDVLIVDVEMPGPGAQATIIRVLQASPTTKVVVLTMHDDPQLVRALVRSGASGYVLKSANRIELNAAIRAAAGAGDSVLVSVSRGTVMGLSQDQQQQVTLVSPRELEILELLAEAHSNRTIAARLHISEGTVKRHLTNIYAKLGATSRLNALRRADELGVLRSRFLTRDGVTPNP